MGGAGSGRKPSEATIVKRLTEPLQAQGTGGRVGDVFVPNTAFVKPEAKTGKGGDLVQGNGTTNTMAYWTGSVFASGASTFFWDDTNKRVGIGTNTPSQKLEVAGNISLSKSSAFMVGGGGNFDIYQNTTDGADSARTRVGGGGDVSTSRGAFIELKGNEHATDPGNLNLFAGDTGDISMTGNVGIGTTTPIVGDGVSPWLTISSNGPGIALVDANNADKAIEVYQGTGIFHIKGMDDDGTNTLDYLETGPAGTVWNQDGLDIDYRIESAVNASSFRMDGATGHIGIGVFPTKRLMIQTSTTAGDGMEMLNSDGARRALLTINSKDFATLALFASGAAQNVSLTSSGASFINGGNLGIGTTSPIRKFEVVDDVASGFDPRIAVSNQHHEDGNSKSSLEFRGGFSSTEMGSMAIITAGKEQTWTSTASTKDGFLDFYTNLDGSIGSSKMRITSAGNVGIGTTIPTSRLHASGAFALPIVSKTAAYTVTANDHTILGDNTSISFTATLPTAVGIKGRLYNFKKINASGAFTIDGNGSETIDQGTTVVINTIYASITVQSDGANWWII